MIIISVSFEHVVYRLFRTTRELSGNINWYVEFVFPYELSVHVALGTGEAMVGQWLVVAKRCDFVTLRHGQAGTNKIYRTEKAR